jgi:hypothetical protein
LGGAAALAASLLAETRQDHDCGLRDDHEGACLCFFVSRLLDGVADWEAESGWQRGSGMYQGVQTCKQCGANLSLDDMRKTHCPYCGTVYPHQAMAAEHAAVINQVWQQQGMGHVQMPQQYGGGIQIGGQSYDQYVQGHVNRANRIMMISLVAGLVIALLVTGIVVAALILV